MNEPAATPWEQTPEAWDAASSGYAERIAPRNAPFADDLIALLSPAPGLRFLDVACGTGIVATRAARAGCAVVAIDFSPNMLGLLEQTVRCERLRIETRRMDGQQLHFADRSFDIAASLFGLQLFADRAAGLRELHRVLVPGGQVAIGAWCGPDRVEILTPLLRAVRRIVPRAPLDPPLIYSLADESAFVAELDAAGFVDITMNAFEHPFHFSDSGEYWRLLETAAPGPIERNTELAPDARNAVKAALDADMRDSFGTAPITLAAAARIAIARA